MEEKNRHGHRWQQRVEEIALHLAQKGMNIVFSYISNDEAAQKTVQEIEEKA